MNDILDEMQAAPQAGETAPKRVRCMFCGKAKEQVRHMLGGGGARICNECVDHARSVMEDADAEDRLEISSELEGLVENATNGWRNYLTADHELKKRLGELEADADRLEWCFNHWLRVTANPTGTNPENFEPTNREQLDELIDRIEGRVEPTERSPSVEGGE